MGKKKNPNNLLLPVLLPGGSASEAAEHPPQPWRVRVPPMEQGIRELHLSQDRLAPLQLFPGRRWGKII